MLTRLAFTCTLIGLAACAQAFAQSAASPAAAASAPTQQVNIEAKAQDEVEVRRDAVAGMSVVDRDELDRYGDTSVLDVLQRQAGISIEGEQPRLRGMGGGYTLILLNGEPAPPGFSLEQLSPSEIERIEIIKGPSAEHGGVAGTINVILRTPPKLQQREWRANTSYRGLQPAGSTSVSWGDRIGDIGFQLPLSVYRWAGEGESFSERFSRGSDGALRESSSTGRDQWRGGGVNFGPRLDWRINEGHTLQWQSFVQRNETESRSQNQTQVQQGLPPSLLASESASRGVWQMARTQLQWSLKEKDGTRYELKASAERSQGDNSNTLLGTAGSSAPLLRETINHNVGERVSAGARLRWPLADGHALSLGGDLERRQREELRRVTENGVAWLTGSVGRPFEAAMQRQVLFVQDDWTISTRASASLGLRGEFIATEANALSGDMQRQRSALWAPIAQLRLALDEKSRDVLRLAVARSSKLPDLSALMGRYSLNTTYERNTPNTPIAADSAGNPALLPERAWALEASFEHYVGGGGVASIGVFHRQIDDLVRRRIALEVVSESTVPRWVSRPSNIGRARASGLELELKGPGEHWLPMLFAPRSGFQLRSALSVYRSAVEQVDDSNARLEGQAPWTASLGFDKLPLKNVFGYGASLNYTPAYTTQQTDMQRLWRDRVRRLDAYALWRFSREVQLRVSIQNVDAVPAYTVTSIEDLDGFTARSSNRRPGRSQFNANLVWRF